MKKRVLLTSVIAISILVLSICLLLLPGQFAVAGDRANALNCLNGFELFFNFKINGDKNYLNENYGGRVSAAGIIILIITLLSIVATYFQKKSSSLTILAGALDCVIGLMYLLMNIWVKLCGYRYNLIYLSWVTYVNGAIILLLGAYLIYFGVRLYQEEVKGSLGQNAVKYNYLKEKKNK